MAGALVEARENSARPVGHICCLIVLAGERLHRLEIVQPHEGHELDAVLDRAAQEIDRPESRDSRGSIAGITSPRTIAS